MISDICVTFHTELLVIIFDFFFKSPQKCDYIVSLLLKEFLTRITDHLPFMVETILVLKACKQKTKLLSSALVFQNSPTSKGDGRQQLI